MTVSKGSRVVVDYGKSMVYSGVVEDVDGESNSYYIKFDNWSSDRNEWFPASKVNLIDSAGSSSRRRRTRVQHFTPSETSTSLDELQSNSGKVSSSRKHGQQGERDRTEGGRARKRRPPPSSPSKRIPVASQKASKGNEYDMPVKQTQQLHGPVALDSPSLEDAKSDSKSETESTADTPPLNRGKVAVSTDGEESLSNDEEIEQVDTPSRPDDAATSNTATENVSQVSSSSHQRSQTQNKEETATGAQAQNQTTVIEPYILYAALTSHPIARKRMLSSIATFDKAWLSRLVILSVTRIKEFFDSSSEDEVADAEKKALPSSLDFPLSCAVLKHLVERHSEETDRSCNSVPAMLSLLSTMLKRLSVRSMHDMLSFSCLSDGIGHWFTLLCCNFIRHGLENCQNSKEWKSFLNRYAEDILIGKENRQVRMHEFLLRDDLRTKYPSISQRLSAKIAEEITATKDKTRHLCTSFQSLFSKEFRQRMEKTLHDYCNQVCDDLLKWLHRRPILLEIVGNTSTVNEERFLAVAKRKPLLSREQARDLLRACSSKSVSFTEHDFDGQDRAMYQNLIRTTPSEEVDV
eukprot:gb/GECG01005129.1/.p1 GENE.gb/GECG01005129.1/~~gb/GECG01005129.1/.p1  ORF type:complete len:578 (+),score=78.07 gb/GECG01005129.1/:1-1734(+)